MSGENPVRLTKGCDLPEEGEHVEVMPAVPQLPALVVEDPCGRRPLPVPGSRDGTLLGDQLTGLASRGTKGFAAAARLHSHDELTELRPEPARTETGAGVAWAVAARRGSRAITSPS